MTIGGRLERLRTATGLNQSETVQAINTKYDTKINGAMWSKWENDRDNPSMDNLRIIAMYFNTSLDYLSGLSDTPTDEIPRTKDALIEYFHKDPKLHILFSLADELSQEDIDFLVNMARKLKGE